MRWGGLFSYLGASDLLHRFSQTINGAFFRITAANEPSNEIIERDEVAVELGDFYVLCDLSWVIHFGAHKLVPS